MASPLLHTHLLTWHTLAYRGAHLVGLAKILNKTYIPDHVSTIINDRTNTSDPLFRNALIFLNFIISKCRSINFHICHIPQFHLPPLTFSTPTTKLNTLIDEIVIPLPSSFLAHTRSKDDWSHLNPSSCNSFIAHIIDYLSHLN